MYWFGTSIRQNDIIDHVHDAIVAQSEIVT